MSRHPFNDPFFDPFGLMNQMHQQMNSMMGAMFNDPFFGPGFSSQQQVQQSRSRLPAPVIEEVHGDHPPTPAGSQPIVEEPDEDGTYRPMQQDTRNRQRGHQGYQGQQQQQQQQLQQQHSLPSMFGSMFDGMGGAGGGAGGGPVYSFSSSSIMTNNGGVTYQKTATARSGPGGVREVQATERDGRTGRESITIQRALGDKARTVTRTRDATGRETSDDQLKGIAKEDAHRFDEQWRQTAERNLLPGRAALAGSAAAYPGPGAAAPSRRPVQPQLQYHPPSSSASNYSNGPAVGRQPASNYSSQPAAYNPPGSAYNPSGSAFYDPGRNTRSRYA